MLEHLASHLGHLNKWATTFPDSEDFQGVRVIVPLLFAPV